MKQKNIESIDSRDHKFPQYASNKERASSSSSKHYVLKSNQQYEQHSFSLSYHKYNTPVRQNLFVVISTKIRNLLSSLRGVLLSKFQRVSTVCIPRIDLYKTAPHTIYCIDLSIIALLIIHCSRRRHEVIFPRKAYLF